MNIDELNALSFRDLMNAISGFYDLERKRTEAMRDIVYGASRFNAANTAMGDNKKIARYRFPWEKPKVSEPLSYDKMKGFFNRISKN